MSLAALLLPGWVIGRGDRATSLRVGRSDGVTRDSPAPKLRS